MKEFTHLMSFGNFLFKTFHFNLGIMNSNALPSE